MTELKTKYVDNNGNSSIRTVNEIYVGKKYDDRQPSGSVAKCGKEVDSIYQVVVDEYGIKKLSLIWSSYINIYLKTENTDEDILDEAKKNNINVEDEAFAKVDDRTGDLIY